MGEPLLSPDPQPGWRDARAASWDADAAVLDHALDALAEAEAVFEAHRDQGALVETRSITGLLRLRAGEYAGQARELRAQQADRPGRTDHRPVTTRRLRAAPPDRPGGAS